MKFVNFIFGLLIFGIVMSVMFSSVESYLRVNGLDGAEEWAALSGDYNAFIGNVTNKDSSVSIQIKDQLDAASASEEDVDVSILKGAVSGGKLIISFYANFEDVVNKVSNDAGGQYISRDMINLILALGFIFLILVVLHFARGFKTEV